MEIDLTGKSALVGGSTGGIGKAIATRLAASGASVCLKARNKSKLEKVVNELDKSRNQKHGFLEVDFSNYKLFYVDRNACPCGALYADPSARPLAVYPTV